MERLKGGPIKKNHMGIRLQSFTGCLERKVELEPFFKIKKNKKKELEPLIYRAMGPTRRGIDGQFAL